MRKSIKYIWNNHAVLNAHILHGHSKHYLACIFVLLVLSIALTPSIGLLQSLRVIYGSVYSLFLPGFLMSHLFFPSRSMDTLERLALSFVLSISIVPLVIFYLNLVGIPISTISTFTIIFIICILITVILVLKKKEGVID